MIAQRRLLVEVFDGDQRLYRGEHESPLEIGRQMAGEAGPFQLSQGRGGCPRIIVVEATRSDVSRRHVRLELDGQCIRLINMSQTRGLRCKTDGEPDPNQLAPGAEREFGSSLSFELSSHQLHVREVMTVGKEIEEQDDDSPDATVALHCLSSPTRSAAPTEFDLAAISQLSMSTLARLSQSDDQHGLDVEPMVRILQTLREAISSYDGDDDFEERVTALLSQFVRSDVVETARLERGQWRTTFEYRVEQAPPPRKQDDARQRLLDELPMSKRTVWQVPAGEQDNIYGPRSMLGSPILDKKDELIGALFVSRYQTHSKDRIEYSKPEAMIFDLAATAIANVWSPTSKTTAVTAGSPPSMSPRLAPEITREIQVDPSLLNGRIESITLLDCAPVDLPRLRDRAGVERVADWLRAASDVITSGVVAASGVIADQSECGFRAIWGAPVPQRDHRARAAECAEQFIEHLRNLAMAHRIASDLESDTGFRITLISGDEAVGDFGADATGSTYRAFGALSTHSRALTELAHDFALDRVISADVHDARPSDDSRRLGRFHLRDTARPIELYELGSRVALDRELTRLYESALVDIEAGNTAAAVTLLSRLLELAPDDRPALALIAQIATRRTSDRQRSARFATGDRASNSLPADVDSESPNP